MIHQVTVEEFHDYIENIIIVHKLTDSDISKITGAARPTVERWINKTGTPHRLSRAGMIKLLQNWLDKPRSQQ